MEATIGKAINEWKIGVNELCKSDGATAMTFNFFGLLIDITTTHRVKRGVTTWGVVVTTKRQDSEPYVRGLSLSWVSEEVS